VEKWRKSVEKEYETITKNKVFRIVDRPRECVLLTCWILGEKILREGRKQKACSIV
jgi:Reverse transcriptase (RNA-dependent DNA polymerase)